MLCRNQVNYDLCVSNELDKLAINKFGCTTPFGNDPDMICRNETHGKKATDFMYEVNWDDLDCKHPCSFVTLRSQVEVESDKNNTFTGKVHFFFNEKVKVLRSQYSFPFLTLIAEVRSYVGLFLGINMLQIYDLLERLSRRFSQIWLKHLCNEHRQTTGACRLRI